MIYVLNLTKLEYIRVYNKEVKMLIRLCRQDVERYIEAGRYQKDDCRIIVDNAEQDSFCAMIKGVTPVYTSIEDLLFKESNALENCGFSGWTPAQVAKEIEKRNLYSEKEITKYGVYGFYIEPLV